MINVELGVKSGRVRIQTVEEWWKGGNFSCG